MSNQIKGFFFDMDGTLVDTYEADYLAYRDAIKEVLGIGVSIEDFTKTHGMEAKDKLLQLAPRITSEQIECIRIAKKKYYTQYLHLTKPNDTLIAFVNEMAKNHIVGLVTNAKRHNAELVLKKHGLSHIFHFCVYGDDAAKPKPDPELYIQALDKAALRAAEVIAFEDTQPGHDAAHAAGIATVDVRSFS